MNVKILYLKNFPKRMFILGRIKCIVRLKVIVSAHFDHINSDFSYGIVVWGNLQNRKIIVLVKKSGKQ